MSISLKVVLPSSFIVLCGACSGSGHTDTVDAEQPEGRSSISNTSPVEIGEHAAAGTASASRSGLSRKQAKGLDTVAPGFLAAESTLVADRGVSAQVATEVLSSTERFSKAIQTMERDALTSSEAQDLAVHYRSAVLRAVGSDGAVESFACGLSVCAGSVRSRLDVDQDAWISRLNDDTSALTFSYVDTVERIGGFNESRFVFSTDPALNAIVTPSDL